VINTITLKEARAWIKQMDAEDLALFVQQHHSLKQNVCASPNGLGVATGEDDWVQRSIEAVYRLRLLAADNKRLRHEVQKAMDKRVF